MLHALAFAAALHAAPGCEPRPRSPAGLLEAEHDWVRALSERNVQGLDCLLDDGFRDNAWNGTVRGKAAMLAALEQRPAGGAIELQEVDVRMEGRMGYVRGLTVSPLGKARFIDVFIHEAGRWRAVAAQETPVRGD